ncbi:patatin-like phospholipase family protein [Streptacidiphilus melanogenes]|uniref:patatin-like phospholipase family protein n=1 Tax=Streptacidiphilus melanogenes TaxID=411235 RepID=UPI0005A87C85|nr:patatin-like phospholipase family protein [Streptacidiphilus melanogenes]
MTDQAKPVDLVLEGGGVKGIGLLGAVLTLVDAGYHFPRVAGTSAGAIVASLIAAYQKDGRDLHGLREVMDTVDYTKFADGPVIARLTGALGQGVEALLHEGAHSGGYLVDWLGAELAKANVVTFADLAISDQDDPDSSLASYQRYSLVVHASDVSRRALVRLPWDYPQYGLQADRQRVVDAVRASMSIPFYFRPVQIETATGTATWVDGGLLSNFPITVFDRTDAKPPRWDTWGIKLSGQPSPAPDHPVKTALGIAITCAETLTSGWNRYHLQEEGVDQRTIFVDTLGIAATDFQLDVQTRQRLFTSGQEAARKFLDRQPRQVPPTS